MKSRSIRCPTCKRKVRRTDPEFPFCSERCRLIDFGNWASGNYRIPTALPDFEDSAPADAPDPLNSESSEKKAAN
ncbi:MAG: DNA gyrase inhibitor YacG [Acidobacteria bacterium]|nr:DNA gyrase inhibitor YacG [Acidobacteriota bacterium]